MSDVSSRVAVLEAVPSCNTHVFWCPCCRNQTTVLSEQNFILLQQTQCENCGREFVIENDVARVITQ